MPPAGWNNLPRVLRYVQRKDSLWRSEVLRGEPKIAMIARGEYRNKSADKIRGSGYAVESLEAALGPLHRQTLAVLNRSLIFLGVMRDFGIYIVRGLLSFQSRRFELSRSSIQFIGGHIGRRNPAH